GDIARDHGARSCQRRTGDRAAEGQHRAAQGEPAAADGGGVREGRRAGAAEEIGAARAAAATGRSIGARAQADATTATSAAASDRSAAAIGACALRAATG